MMKCHYFLLNTSVHTFSFYHREMCGTTLYQSGPYVIKVISFIFMSKICSFFRTGLNILPKIKSVNVEPNTLMGTFKFLWIAPSRTSFAPSSLPLRVWWETQGNHTKSEELCFNRNDMFFLWSDVRYWWQRQLIIAGSVSFNSCRDFWWNLCLHTCANTNKGTQLSVKDSSVFSL